jgi:hypothetical protein
MTLQTFEDSGETLVAHAGDKIEVNPGILERTAEAQHEGKLLRRQLVSVADEGGREIISGVVAKLGV